MTCGFAALRPALSRRPRAVGTKPRAPLDGRELTQDARPQPLPSVGVQFVPVLTSFARGAGMLRSALGWDRIPPSRPRSRRLTLALLLQALGLRTPRAFPVALWTRHLRARLPRGARVWGSSAPIGSRPRSHCVRLGNREGTRRLCIRRRWRSCRRRHGNLLANPLPRRGHLSPLQGHAGSPDRVTSEGGVIGELREGRSEERGGDHPSTPPQTFSSGPAPRGPKHGTTSGIDLSPLN